MSGVTASDAATLHTRDPNRALFDSENPYIHIPLLIVASSRPPTPSQPKMISSARTSGPVRASLGRAPLVKPVPASRMRSIRARVLEKAREGNDTNEAELREGVDAFAELQAMGAKQSVNRRQKVRGTAAAQII